MDQATSTATAAIDATNGTNNNGNANLRVIVDSLVTEVKDKHDVIDAKNNQIRDLLDRLERVNQRLGERESTIDELKKKLENSVPELIPDTAPEGIIFPAEIFDIIFQHSSATTRVNLAATNSYFRSRYHQWKDVTSVYITRESIKFLPKAIVIPHSFHIRTNIKAVASFSCTDLIKLAPSLFYVKQMLIESNQYRLQPEYNRIQPQKNLFQYFPNLEFVKICNASENLNLRYNLTELLSLPNLKTLHIKEVRADFDLPDANTITSPLQQLRVTLAYRNHVQLNQFLEALSPTLTSLDFTTLRLSINSQIGGEFIPAVTSKCLELIEFHIPSIVSRHSTFDSTLSLLKNLTKLKRISFEIMHLSNLVNIIENLPPSCDYLIVTDTFYIRGEMFNLSSGSTVKYDKMFTGTNYEFLQFECNRIHRGNLIIQFGRLRGIEPTTIIRNVTGNIQIISNTPFEKRRLINGQENRVFWADGVVLTRQEFLTRMGIAPLEN